MALKKTNPTQTKAWKKLQEHFETIKDVHMKELFANNPDRTQKLTLRYDDFYVDFSKNRMTSETLNLFEELADEIHLSDAVSKYFSGDKINETEDRAVLHTALRVSNDKGIKVDGKNIIPDVLSVKQKIKKLSDQIISGDKKGYTNKSFTDIVNIGIGGSDLGPSMVVEALQYYRNHLKLHFISNVDGDHVNEILKELNPETTFFVIVSKSFTTQETLTNANTVRSWFLKHTSKKHIAKHFVAISTNIKKVEAFGIDSSHIFPMWNWVGGRFSLWSAVGLSVSLAIGYNHFEQLLLGAHKMDVHFKEQSFTHNIPVILACISIWYNNFYKAESEAVIVYSQYLSQFATYLQQASMESNGKTIDRNGKSIDYQTGTIIWGEPGTNSQHAFFQLIHQGSKLIPSDFIAFLKPLHNNKAHHDILIANCIAQTEALLCGKSEQDIKDNSNFDQKPYKVFQGNKPTNTIFINKLTPENLGKLIAMYEHKIFVQGVIWNIFSYDQFGVELGKELANTILKDIKSAKISHHDTSTMALIQQYKN